MEAALTKAIEHLYSVDVVGILALLESGTHRFHATHYLVLILKWLLITNWGRVDGFMHK